MTRRRGADTSTVLILVRLVIAFVTFVGTYFFTYWFGGAILSLLGVPWLTGGSGGLVYGLMRRR